ncbi:hypothetical protein PLESTB_000772900 [Pleodorina starrii]|uniref:Uncharacterized protein n=1 Tax=Pleodorina starrii TaxID=330485 RepID=A0A9W6F1Y1_9CHLO|nr:hypothetical protein PLESTM_000432500 [Pleodorina starrii]GLC53653.1 hypothetical protein PLESTB_000772900 [Pleodorina starrii]GLC65651.1 hypothetical protein PLESTF_000325400 [Pleodorina starrii]
MDHPTIPRPLEWMLPPGQARPGLTAPGVRCRGAPGGGAGRSVAALVLARLGSQPYRRVAGRTGWGRVASGRVLSRSCAAAAWARGQCHPYAEWAALRGRRNARCRPLRSLRRQLLPTHTPPLPPPPPPLPPPAARLFLRLVAAPSIVCVCVCVIYLLFSCFSAVASSLFTVGAVPPPPSPRVCPHKGGANGALVARARLALPPACRPGRRRRGVCVCVVVGFVCVCALSCECTAARAALRRSRNVASAWPSCHTHIALNGFGRRALHEDWAIVRGFFGVCMRVCGCVEGVLGFCFCGWMSVPGSCLGLVGLCAPGFTLSWLETAAFLFRAALLDGRWIAIAIATSQPGTGRDCRTCRADAVQVSSHCCG